MPTLIDLRKKLTEGQRALLSAIWDYYFEKDRWIPRRVLHQQLKPLRKQGVQAALKPLGGSVVHEARDAGEEVYRLTLVGALLTDRGQQLEDHLVRLLEYFRDRFDSDPEIKGFSGEDIQADLDLTAEQANALFQLVWISNLCAGCSKGRDLQEWRFGLPYDIEDIPEEARNYLEPKILEELDPSVPFAAGERERYVFRRSGGDLDHPADLRPPGGESVAELPEGTSRRGRGADLTEGQIRKLRAYRKSMLALQEHYRGLAADRTGVVPLGQFRVFAGQVEEIEREVPGLLPAFVAEDFFAERFPSGDHYNISTILSYLASALARIEAELAVTRLALEGLHPEIVTAAGGLFADGHYAEAIFAAFRAVEVRVRQQSGIDSSGRDLMSKAFGGEPPTISVESVAGRSGQDEQEGFKLIFMGAMQGIRNPKGHELIQQADPQRTLEYLAFASLLMRRLDDAAAKAGG